MKEFIYKTLEDTIGFIQVHIRMLEVLRDKTESEERAAGIQDAIDALHSTCQTGWEVGKAMAQEKADLLKVMLKKEQENG